MKVLCLHDAHSNAIELQHSLQKLQIRLRQRHSIELVFVNAPTIDTPTSTTTTTTNISISSSDTSIETPDTSLQSRVWYETVSTPTTSSTGSTMTENNSSSNNHDTGHQVSNDQQTRYIGLDASLMWLTQWWTSQVGREEAIGMGVLAVGQGAAVASLWSLLPNLQPPPSFFIFVNGYSLIQNPHDEISLPLSNIPSLHIHSSEQLVQQYPNNADNVDSANSSLPSHLSNHHVLNVVGRFLVQRQQDQTTNHSAALLINRQLHQVEERAQELMAQTVSRDPPAALMAIIQPTTISPGWAGNRGRENIPVRGAPFPTKNL